MAGTIKANAVQLGDSGTATQNFVLQTNVDGTATLGRGNVGAISQNILTVDASGLVTLTQGKQLTPGTAVNTTSGTAFDFTNISSSANRVTIVLNGVTLTGGTGRIAVQIGTGSTPQTTGYTSVVMGASNTPAIANTSFTTGVYGTSVTTAVARYGSIVFKRVSGNVWVWDGMFYENNVGLFNFVMGSVTLSGALNVLRLTSSTTDTFSAGSANILIE